MPQRTTRANGSSPLQSLEREFNRVRKQVRTQSKSIEKQLEKGRKELESQRKKLETRSRKQVESMIAEVRKSPVVKRAEAFRKDAEKQIESTVEGVLSALQIASKSDVEKIDRKLKSLNKKLSSLDKPAA